MEKMTKAAPSYPNGPLRFVGDKKRIINIIMLVLAFLFGMLIRKHFIWFVSRDWTIWFEPWMNEIAAKGAASLAEDFYDYAPSYMYLLLIAAKFGSHSMIAMKLISVFFDVVVAVAAGLILYEARKSETLAAIGCSIVFLTPTVISNSAMWGQCDSIYTSFLLLTVLFLLKDKSRIAMVFYGIAFAFKLQALFWAPIIILLWLYKKIKSVDLLWVPGIYFLSIIPAWILGRPLGELLGIYFAQTGVDTNRLSMKYPNIYYIIGELYLPDWYSTGGKIFALGVILLFMVAVVYKLMHTKLTPELLLFIIYTQGALALYFLPQMHERYGYFIEIIGILIGILCIRLFWVPVVHVLITFLTYSYYYNYDQPDRIIIPYSVLAIVMLGIVLYMTYQTFTYQEKKEIDER